MEGNPVKSILEMARGAIQERVDLEMARVIENITDENTKATATRKLTLTIEFKPDEERQLVQVAATAKTTLAAANPASTALYVGKYRGETCAVEMAPQLPGQMDVNGGVQEPRATLKVVNFNNE